MDSSDMSIIGILLLDSRTPLSAMAKELGISQPAVQKRIRKLKDAGIILGSTVV
jgi:DNA-binding Lrp family transcriptional regulator